MAGSSHEGELAAAIGTSANVLLGEFGGFPAGHSDYVVGARVRIFKQPAAAEILFGSYTDITSIRAVLNTAGTMTFGYRDAAWAQKANGTITEVPFGRWAWICLVLQGSRWLRVFIDGIKVHEDTGDANAAELTMASTLRVYSNTSAAVAEAFMARGIPQWLPRVEPPRQIWVPTAAAPSMPTLSLPTVTAIGATQATPRVTLTY
ncbi:MAG: hypothetical protein ABS84_14860 [Rubrivivax sp. SCN 71-131]|nr:MAG: hypothetical protein ABS84_14860 [Rubrivivax sp. SCN 71-131]